MSEGAELAGDGAGTPTQAVCCDEKRAEASVLTREYQPDHHDCYLACDQQRLDVWGSYWSEPKSDRYWGTTYKTTGHQHAQPGDSERRPAASAAI